jgi:glycosyltransferase involved in cell wall biosynthesis
MNDMQSKLDYADAIADYFLDIGEARSLEGDLEEGLKYTYIAANILSRQNRTLSSLRVESNLLFVASRLTADNGSRPSAPQKNKGKDVCLHVLNEALPAGGHTAMAIRWMRNDSAERIHSVALLSREIPIPDGLLEAVSHSGGVLYEPNPGDTLLSRAAWLRNLSRDIAKYVILHIDVCDVICAAAYGVKGGPPVMLVNHAAHIFWTGISIADVVVNCRGSALEDLWTTKYRGSSKCTTVPIPLLEQNAQSNGNTSDHELRHEAKERLGFPTDSSVILTVGASFKYLPANGLDFLEVCESVLKQLPNAFLLVVGFEPDSRWRRASQRLDGRIRVLGTLLCTELAIIKEATDIYIEGFPFGTTTSLLEAALNGIPVVLAPGQCPPPYGSDGVALDVTVARPRTVEEYKTQIIQLSNSQAARTLQSENLRDSVRKHHTGAGWRRYLNEAIRSLPLEHSTYPSINPVRTPGVVHEYWSTLIEKISSGYEEALETSYMLAITMKLRPSLNTALQRVCKNYSSVRIHRTVPMPFLVVLCNRLSSVIPITWEQRMLRILSFLFRGSLLPRVLRRVLRLLGRTECPQGYEAYRKIRGNQELFNKNINPQEMYGNKCK